MSDIVKMCVQRAVYWPPTSADGYGRPGYGTAVELLVRWQDEQKEFLDDKSNRNVSNAVVYVLADLAIGGVLWLSTKRKKDAAGTGLAECVYPDAPLSNAGAYKIRQVAKFPDERAKEYLRTVML